MNIAIANLPNQKHRKVAKKGSHLTMLVVGESGLGKTTFVNTLFTTSLCSHRDYSKRGKESKDGPTTKIKITEAELEERGFKLKLTIVDTPGFGDYVDNTECYAPVVEYIEAQYNSYLNQEMQADRSSVEDTRVHVCLYFIEPSGHSLKTLDILAMKEIGSRVNLVPIIAKADTISPEELRAFKERIREEIASHDIQTYSCPIESEDEEATIANKEIAAAFPFAVISSEDLVSVGDKKVRGRQYLWGVAEVENEKHCDFKKLRSLLLRTHLLDIITTAEETHYENFRDRQLEKGGLGAGMTPEKAKKDLQSKQAKQEEQMKKKFTEDVKKEEARFRAWEEKLSTEGEKLNAELDQKRAEINSLKEEIKQLELKTASSKKK